MKKIMITLFLSVMFISLITACGEPIKQGEPVRLIFPSNATSLNITVEFVNQSGYWIDNQAMTKSGYSFYYDFYNTTDLGLLKYFACDDVGDCDYSCSKEITPSGKSGNSNIVFYVFLILAFYAINLFGFFGKNEILTLLGGMALMFVGVYLVNNGIIIYRDTLTNYFAYITIAWGAVSSLLASYSLYENM